MRCGGVRDMEKDLDDGRGNTLPKSFYVTGTSIDLPLISSAHIVRTFL